MAINKVVINEDGNTRTLIDITDSTVNPETLADGVVAYDKKGEKIAGTLKAEDFYNFDVVGNPQPANPKENTVWVNTDTPITSWVFRATEPAPSDVMALSFLDGYPWYLLAPQSLSAGDVLSFEIPEGVPSFYELVNISDPTTGDMYFVRNSDGSACNAWVKGTKVSVVLSNDTNEINGYGSDAKTAYIRSYGSYGMTEGMVWIPTGASSTAEFNALKKNGIMVYPVGAFQCVNGVMVKKEAMAYIDKWIPFKTYLYNEGDENTALTGGWIGESRNLEPGGGAGSPVITKNSDSLTMGTAGNGSNTVHRPKNKIDLTNYTTLKYEGTLPNPHSDLWHFLAVWSQLGTYAVDYRAAWSPLDGTEGSTLSIDVSALSGEFYIGFSIYTSPAVTMKKLWLE